MSLKRNFSRFNTLKQFDAFARPMDELQIKTVWGGVVTLTCCFTILYLMIFNLIEYLDNTPTEELLIDTSRNKKLQINFDIIIPKISCDFLVLDAVDNSGETHLQIDHIFKQNLNADGQPVSDAEKSDVGNSEQYNSKSVQGNDTQNKTFCGSCYGAETLDIQCCNTCDDVMQAYKGKNWDFNPSNIVQCNNQSYENMYEKGCNIYGKLLVNRVSGNFHMAPGMSFSFNNMHVHDVNPLSSTLFNTTHLIRHLSFGQKLESFSITGGNPLDSTLTISEEGGTMFQYFIKIVPTLYQRSDGTILSTNQFSITKHKKIIAFNRGTTGMPGIFFNYEFSPIMVKFTEKSKYLGHLFTQFLSNISGVFICFWIIDIFMYKITKMYHTHKIFLPDNNK